MNFELGLAMACHCLRSTLEVPAYIAIPEHCLHEHDLGHKVMHPGNLKTHACLKFTSVHTLGGSTLSSL